MIAIFRYRKIFLISIIMARDNGNVVILLSTMLNPIIYLQML